MIASILEKHGIYYCSNCMMRIEGELDAHCCFCGCSWSNYEDVVIKIYEDSLKSDI